MLAGVEPSPAHMAEAKKLLWSRNVIFLPIALSETEESATLYKDAEISGLASLTKRRLDHLSIDMSITEQVQCRTLDSIVSENNVSTIDLLKIDVEGHELSVLRGAKATFSAGKIAAVQFEFGGCNLDTRTNLQDFFYFFADYGFELHVIRPRGDFVRLSKYSELMEQYRTTNFLAIQDRQAKTRTRFAETPAGS
jgi:FkbM family methyltransferase